MNIKKLLIFLLYLGISFPTYCMWKNVAKNFFNKKALFATAAVATTGTVGLLSYKYPAWFDYCKNKYTYLRLGLAQNRKVSQKEQQERERVNKLLDEHCHDIRMMFNNRTLGQEQKEKKTGGSYIPNHPRVIEFPWLPGYLIKQDVTRIEGAQVIEDCIKEHNLRHVSVAEKWLHMLPGQEPVVVAKKVEHVEGKPMTVDQVKDLCCVVKNAKYRRDCHYWDFNGGNVAHTSDGRLVFRDTESTSFSISQFIPNTFIRLALATHDEDVKEYLMSELMAVNSKMFVNDVLSDRINLLYGVMKKLGYTKDEARNEIRQNIKKNIPLLDANGFAACEEQINNLDKCQYEKQDPKKLTAKQRKCIDQFLNENRLSEKYNDEYTQCMGLLKQTPSYHTHKNCPRIIKF